MITCAGRRVELIQSFLEASKSLKLNNKIICTDSEPLYSSACSFAHKYCKTPKISNDNYIDNILKIAKENKVKIIIPTIDTELIQLSESRKMFLNHGIEVIISNPNLIKICNDKRASGALFEKLGFKVPKIFLKDAIEYPCFCKPYDGSNSSGARIIYSENEITDEMHRDENLIYMELIPKSFAEYTVDVYFDQHAKMKCIVPRKRIEVRGGEVSKGITKKNFLYEDLLSKISELEGARGCITFQFFVDEHNKNILGLEINPRFGGGYPLTVAANANYSRWILEEYVSNKKINFFDEWENDLLMLRYDAKITRKL